MSMVSDYNGDEDVVSGNSSSSNEMLTNMPVFQLSTFQLINRMLCTGFGIPLNVLILFVIIRSRSLNRSPRNAFWLTVTSFNLLALVKSLMELAVYYLHRRSDGSHVLLCQFYSVAAGCPYALLLTALTLASADRYSAIAHPQFYQRHVSPTRIRRTLFVISTIIIGGHTLPYWTGFLHPQCIIHMDWMVVTLCFHGLMSATCSLLQIKLFRFVRQCIRYSSTQAHQCCRDERVPVADATAAVASLSNSTKGSHPSSSSSGSGRTTTTAITTPSGYRLSQLEVRAAQILTVGLIPFCLVNLPLSATSLAFYVVRTLWGPESCLWLAMVMQSLREFILLHLVYIPAVFAAQSEEFRAAAKRRCCCYCYCYCIKERQSPVERLRDLHRFA